MNNFLKKYFKGDQGIWWTYLILCFISAIIMYSASSFFVHSTNESHWMPVMEHIFFLIIGMGCAWVIHHASVQMIRLGGYVIFFAFMVALCLMYSPDFGVKLNGALRWVRLPLIPTFQPSEGVKLGLILVVADLLKRIGPLKDNTVYWWVVLVVAVPCGLILFSNFSTVLLILVVMFCMLAMSNLNKKLLRLGIPILLGLSLCVGVYFLVKAIPADNIPDSVERVVTWVNRVDRFMDSKANAEEQNPFSAHNLQITQGKIAIARGGFLGVGPGNSILRDYVSLAFADSIFAVIVEEFGLVGAFVLIMLYMVLFFRAGRIIFKSDCMFTSLACFGLTFMMLLQVMVNIGVVVGMIPVTGQLLPFVGHGGTSIIITSCYMGVLLALSRSVEEQNNMNTTEEKTPMEDSVQLQEIDVVSLDDAVEEMEDIEDFK